jgi:putative N-acetyltransferase (TIGR04045 family)
VTTVGVRQDRRPGAVSCRLVTGTADLIAIQRIRHAVFVREQAIFAASDTDIHDPDPATLFVLGDVAGVPAGTVRLFPLENGGGLWQGDRLAVLPEFRAAGIGAPLVRLAVATASARGGSRMLAHIQVANERFFTRLGWSVRSGPEDYLGHPHLLMDIALDDSRPAAPALVSAAGSRDGTTARPT